MDAVKFLKAFNRMCNNYKETCMTCPLERESCDLTSKYCNPEKVVSVVEQWAKTHLITKTRQSEFLKMFPTAAFIENGALDVCPATVDSMKRDETSNRCGDITKSCFDCKRDYWMQEGE